MKVSVMIARFPGGYSEHPACVDWLMQTCVEMERDPRIDTVKHFRISDTPITMGRNRAIEEAKKAGVDLLLMVDSDMGPDRLAPGIASPKRFWDEAFNFWWDKAVPCVVCAPYCGPPPHENVYVFRWRCFETGHPNQGDFKLDQYTREEAAMQTGIREVAAIPTGLCLIDMRVFTGLKSPLTGTTVQLRPPYFRYEWTDVYEQQKASTEDVVFSRDLSLLGIPMYCTWDAWAIHYKPKPVSKPYIIAVEQIAKQYIEAIERGWSRKDKLIDVDYQGDETNDDSYDPDVDYYGLNKEEDNGPVCSD